MSRIHGGNLLMVSNYPSDTAYAWWLMEHFWKTLANRFAQAGSKAYLAYPKITSIPETIATAPIEPVMLPIPWRSREEASNVREFLRKKRISSVYFTDQRYFSHQYLMLRLSGVTRIVTHDHTPGDRPPVDGIKGALKAARNAMPWFTADRVLCISELMRQRSMENARIPAQKCVVVQNGIPPVDCVRHKRNALREDLCLHPDSIVVITTGRAHPYKRFDFVIECANALRSRAPQSDIVFLLVGDGPAMPDLRAMVRRLKLEKSIHLLGFRTDVHDLLCISDIALHASLGEGFSLSIIEYMSASLPVLVPNIPSVCQAISHNETGIVYTKDDSEAVAAHILALATETQTRLAMGTAAKAYADDSYNLEQCTERFQSAVEEAYFGNTEKFD